MPAPPAPPSGRASASPGARLTDLQGVLFDLDGTLVRTFAYYRRAIAARLFARDERGERHPLLVLRALWRFGRHRDALRRGGQVDPELHAHQFSTVAGALGVPAGAVEAIIGPLCYSGSFDGLREGVRPGVRFVVEAIHAAGLKVGVLSDFPVEIKLRACGLLDLPWDVLTDSERAGALKPHTAPYLAALALMGTDAARTLYVGDRRDTDIAGARKVGMPSVLIGASLFRTGPEPDHRIACLAELGTLLGLSVRAE